jgi:hypothetical protein
MTDYEGVLDAEQCSADEEAPSPRRAADARMTEQKDLSNLEFADVPVKSCSCQTSDHGVLSQYAYVRRRRTAGDWL